MATRIKENLKMWKMCSKLQHRGDKSENSLQARLTNAYEKSKRICRNDQFKKIYLVIFNFVQTVGFLYVLTYLAMLYLKLGPVSFAIAYKHIGSTVKVLHIMQLMETIHPIVGYCKGGPSIPLVQLSGRLVILFMMLEPVPKIQTNPAVPYLFTVWSIIEVIRHLYYVFQLLKKEIPLLTWIRYTAWMLLYPMGIYGEAYVMYCNIPYFQETMKFSVTLPNSWNFSLNFVIFIKIYVLSLIGPTMYILTSHMYKMRVKKMVNFHF